MHAWSTEGGSSGSHSCAGWELEKFASAITPSLDQGPTPCSQSEKTPTKQINPIDTYLRTENIPTTLNEGCRKLPNAFASNFNLEIPIVERIIDNPSINPLKVAKYGILKARVHPSLFLEPRSSLARAVGNQPVEIS